MEVVLNFEWNKHFKRWGFPMFIESEGVSEIASWIISDIDSCGDDAPQRMIERLRGIQAGKEKKGYIGTGNAHDMYAFDESLFLVCQFGDEKKVILPIEEAIKALEGFAKFKSGDWKNPNWQPEPFVVSYDYEGQEAEAIYSATGLPWGLSDEVIEENTRKVNAMGKNS